MLNQILWTALITPFKQEDLRIDYESLRTCLLMQEQENNGIIVLGSTGESLSLTKREKISLLQFISDLGLKIPVICGIPNDNFFSAIEWIRLSKDFVIDGFLASTPIYTKAGIIGQTKWFEALLEASHVPMMIYDVPSRTGIPLYSSVVIALKDHERFHAVKDSSGSLEAIGFYRNEAPKLSIYSGNDDMMEEMAKEGAVGLVSVASNVWAAEVRDYVLYCLSGHCEHLHLWHTIFEYLKKATNPVPIKALMQDINIINSDIVRLPLSQEDFLFRDNLLERHGDIARWKHVFEKVTEVGI